MRHLIWGAAAYFWAFAGAGGIGGRGAARCWRRRRSGRCGGNVAARNGVGAIGTQIAHDAFVDRFFDLVFLLDQLLHALRMSAPRRRALVTAVVAAGHQRANLRAFDAPASLGLCLHLAHHLACLLKARAVASALIATRRGVARRFGGAAIWPISPKTPASSRVMAHVRMKLSPMQVVSPRRRHTLVPVERC